MIGLNRKGAINFPLVLFIFLAVILLRMQLEKLFNPTEYKGPWYKVTIPVGWEMKKLEDEVVFLSPETDLYTELPETIFSIYAKKSTGSLFLGELIGEVHKELGRVGAAVLKEGDVDIDGKRARWLLFRNKDPELMVLTFFIVDDFNCLTKIQFATKPERFNDYRPAFEAFKGSFQFTRLF